MRRSPYMTDHWQRSKLEEIKRQACEEARRLGAVAVRVADAAHDSSTHKAMRESFERGDLATWPYGEEYAQKAASPETVLSGAKAVICIAVPYRTEAGASGPLHGRVSNYAWSPDYHHRVKALLRSVAHRIDEAAGSAVTAIACDTKPLAERAFAARAGLGWVGKHTNLITPAAGSFVFLGEIVTSLPLEPDAPLRKTCGACTRCIPACPTGALRADYTIDATRCIADLTQRTDAIPRELRPYVGTWVWGCDLCQLACPPNAHVTAAAGPLNAPTSEATSTPSLVSLLRLRSGEYKRTYRVTAMGWRGAAVLRRNAAVALGNSLDRSAVPALVESLNEDPSPIVRGHTAWALGRIGSPQALDALERRLEHEPDAGVRAELRIALETNAGARALQAI